MNFMNLDPASYVTRYEQQGFQKGMQLIGSLSGVSPSSFDAIDEMTRARMENEDLKTQLGEDKLTKLQQENEERV